MQFPYPVPFEMWYEAPSSHMLRGSTEAINRYSGTIDSIKESSGHGDIAIHYIQKPDSCSYNNYVWFIDEYWYASVGGIILHGDYTEEQLKAALSPLIDKEERNTL